MWVNVYEVVVAFCAVVYGGADLRGDVLGEGAAVGDVGELHAEADSECGFAGFDPEGDEFAFEIEAFGGHGDDGWVGLFLVCFGWDVCAADDYEAVECVDVLADDLFVCEGGQDDGRAAVFGNGFYVGEIAPGCGGGVGVVGFVDAC